MSANPYQAPKEGTEQILSTQHAGAIRSLRSSLLILLIPAIYNFGCFNFALQFNRVQLNTSPLDRSLNLFGFILIIAAVWCFGLPVLEGITRMIHSVLGRSSGLDEWLRVLYAVLRRAPLLAIMGALLWTTWIVAYYQLGINFFWVSIPIATAAHLLAACLYVPLVTRWYRVEREARKEVGN